MFFRKTKKIAVTFLLVLFLFSSLTEFIFSAEPAQAQMPVTVLADVVKQADQVWTMVKNTWKVAVMSAAQQAVSYFMRKVAYDTAVYIASGGKGQNPFANTSGMYDYLSQVGGGAVGTAVDSLGKGWGLDLCHIPDLKIDLALRIGLHYNYGTPPPPPACDLKTLEKNWGSDAWQSRYGSDIGKTFTTSLSVDDTDMGIGLKTMEKLDRLYLTQTDSAKAQNIQNQGWKDFTGLIDGRIKTPASVIQQEAKSNTPSQQNAKSQAQVGYAMGSGAYEIIPSTLSLFLNTLTGQMLKNFKENGMLPFGTGCVEIPGVTGQKCPKPASSASAASAVLVGRAAAQAIFSEFLNTSFASVDNYDVESLLRSCPEQRGLYNCRIDEQFVSALEADKVDRKPVTIQEALKNGWLNGSWPLITPTNYLLNTDPHCYDGHYCYSNLQVLRQLGILPIGMEIAALHSNADSPVTLQQVVNGFYNCAKPDSFGKINYDQVNFPYCHLVDPNWVIKLPDTRCDAVGYTAVPLDGLNIPDRIQECTDLKTCVGKDDSGHCLSYANCVRTKNVWNFDGDKCDPQYSTCRAFTDSNGQQVAYLSRTLDTGSCNQNNVGCNAYSLQKDDTGNWLSVGQLVTSTSYGNYSTGVYLNAKITTCDSSAAGCSAFKVVNPTSTGNVPEINNGSDLRYLKKAPDYLHCYDANLTAAGVQWPQTFSDLVNMDNQKNPDCANYAQVCIADEVGCNSFTNVDDPQASPVPGKFTPATLDNSGTVQQWNDQCDKSCVGYAAFQELATDFSAGNPMVYVVPPSSYNDNSSGLECTSQDDGCSAFTNMESTLNGGEKVEDFTHLRACMKPDATKQANYYTYEGAAVGGYQLKTYALEIDPTVDTDPLTLGLQVGPLTVYATPEEKTYALTRCNVYTYKAGQADNDCRQFNDDKGNVYYAQLSHTVVVSADCTQYRLDSENPLAGNQCMSGGQYKNGACYYFGLPGNKVAFGESSNSCLPEMVSCRGYKGNHSNKISSLFNDNFVNLDPTDINNGWSTTNGTIAYSTESTHSTGHSLEFAGNTNAVLNKAVNITADSIDLHSDTALSLTFWAKGTGETVEVVLVDNQNSNTVSVGKFSASSVWRAFKFDPIKWPHDGSASISFRLVDSGNLFLDNVRLAKVTELTYLIKNSLKVDPLCDDDPNDNLPGAALGCTAYSGPDNTLGDNMYYLTNFSYLCREGSVGCTAYVDTFNKPVAANVAFDGLPVAYNVWLPGLGGDKVTANVGDAPSCQIEVGKSGCYVNVHDANAKDILNTTVLNSGLGTVSPQFLASTYFLPADNTSSLSYLVYNSQSSCEAPNLGCTYAGVQKNTPQGISYATTTIMLDPSQFETNGSQVGTMCSAEAVGCGDFGGSYFKDPSVTGAKVCSFGDFTVSGAKVKGWYWKGVGTCSNNTSTSTTYCTSANDCGTGNTCDNINNTPCYANNFKNAAPIGQYYDMWSYGNTSTYKNFVGECPVEQDKCTEFVDHNDSDKSYTFIKNDKITSNDCDNQVSQKAGCILFDELDNPSKYWSTAGTYKASDSYLYDPTKDALNATKVPPQSDSNPNNNDANVIIKVTRDRECAEWLQCKSAAGQWNSELHKMEEKCDGIGLCDKLSTIDNAGGKEATCAEFVDGQTKLSNKVLSEDLYVQRNVSWQGLDLTGLSILGSYPLNEMEQFSVTGNPKDTKLVKVIPCGGGDNCQIKFSVFTAGKSQQSYQCKNDDQDGGVCGVNNDGECIKGKCLQNNAGIAADWANFNKDSIGSSCRAYPEKDSPFPAGDLVAKDQKYKAVNKCSNIAVDADGNVDGNACDCTYTRLTFGNNAISRFYGPAIPAQMTGGGKGLCSGGQNDGNICNPADSIASSTCGVSGSCLPQDRSIQNISGWPGYCLEYDKSRILHGTSNADLQYPCLTWLPIDLPKGFSYQKSQEPKASPMNSVADNTKYCLKADVYRRLPVDYDFVFHSWSSSKPFLGWSNSSCADEFRGHYFHPKNAAGDTPNPHGDPNSVADGKIISVPQCNVWNSNNDSNPNYWYHGSFSVGSWCSPPNEVAYGEQGDAECGTGFKMDENPSDVIESGGLCQTKCVVDPAYQDIWSANLGWSTYTAVGCTVDVETAGLHDGFVSWSDRLWKGLSTNSNPSYVLDTDKIISTSSAAFAGKLNFNVLTPEHPFASFLDSDSNPLYRLNACYDKSNFVFSKPDSAGNCATGDIYTQDGLFTTASSILSYDPWYNLYFRKYGNPPPVSNLQVVTNIPAGYCNNASDCTPSSTPITCQNHVAAAKCVVTCGTTAPNEALCAMTYKNISTSHCLKDNKYGGFTCQICRDSNNLACSPGDPGCTCALGDTGSDLFKSLTGGSALTCNISYGQTKSSCESVGTNQCVGSCSNSTSTCTTDFSCYDKFCDKTIDPTKAPLGQCVDMSFYTAPPPTIPNNDSSIGDAFRLLSQIYAKIPLGSIKKFGVVEVQSKNINKYQTTNAYNALPSLDITGDVNIFNNAYHVGTSIQEIQRPSDRVPVVHPVGDCDGDKCLELTDKNGFTINGKNPADSSDNVMIFAKPFPATVKYFYGVDPNHMPVRETIVDFDEAIDAANSVQLNPSLSIATYRGYVKGNVCGSDKKCHYEVDPQYNNNINATSSIVSNQNCTKDTECTNSIFPICVPESNATAFTYIVDQSCVAEAQPNTYDYTCTSDSSNPNFVAGCPLDTAFKGNVSQFHFWHDTLHLNDCCVYHPKIQVLDNWGWCNGVCKTGDDNTDSCYNGSSVNNKNGVNECDYGTYTYKNASTEFGANVIVAPNVLTEIK